MSRDNSFAAKFRLALQALSISKVEFAALMGVDKSLVGRWASGSVHPSEHNLARMSKRISERVPGFTLADWDSGTDAFARKLGLASDAASNAGDDPDPLLVNYLQPFLDIARSESMRRGAGYEGFWRTSRPSVLMQDRLFHDYGMIRKAANGLLQVRMRGSGLAFEGWMLPAEGNLFVTLYDSTGFTPITLIFRGVTLHKALVLDGLMLLAALDAQRTPAALPVLLERIGDLSGDRDADEARFVELAETGAEPVSGVPHESLLAHLIRDIGPAAEAQGGERLLVAGGLRNLSRGEAAHGKLIG